MSQSKIAEWIEAQADKYEEGTLKLRYLADSKNSNLPATQLDEWPLDKDRAHEVAERAWNSAGNDARTFDECPRYELVLVVTQGGKTEQKARHGFRVDARRRDADYDNLPMGEATVGFMKQIFSHNEVITRTLVSLVMASENSKLRELERLSKRTAVLEELVDRARDEVERAKDKNHERALAKAKFEGDEKRLNELVTTGRTMAPFLVNSIAKKALLPTGDTSVLLEALKPIMESMTEEQYSKLQEIMTPSQLVGLAEIYKLAKGEERDAERRRKENKDP